MLEGGGGEARLVLVEEIVYPEVARSEISLGVSSYAQVLREACHSGSRTGRVS